MCPKEMHSSVHGNWREKRRVELFLLFHPLWKKKKEGKCTSDFIPEMWFNKVRALFWCGRKEAVLFIWMPVDVCGYFFFFKGVLLLVQYISINDESLRPPVFLLLLSSATIVACFAEKCFRICRADGIKFYGANALLPLRRHLLSKI